MIVVYFTAQEGLLGLEFADLAACGVDHIKAMGREERRKGLPAQLALLSPEFQ